MLTNGGPNYQTQVLLMDIRNLAFPAGPGRRGARNGIAAGHHPDGHRRNPADLREGGLKMSAATTVNVASAAIPENKTKKVSRR